MSHRFPVSLATKTFRMLLDANPGIRLDELTGDPMADLRSSSYQRVVSTYIPGPSGRPEGMRAYAAAAANYLAGIRECPTPDDLGFLKRWASCKQVYRFGCDLADSLASSRVDAVPAEALRRMPYPIVYVDAALGGYRGFLAYAEEVAGEARSLRITFIDSDMRRYPYFLMLKDGRTLEEVRKDFRKEAEAASLAGIHVEEDAEAKADLAFSAISLLLYILSDNAEEKIVSAPPQSRGSAKPGRKANPETVHEMGARLGRAIGEAKRGKSADGAGLRTGRHMPPHVRAAHFTHYWIGPRKGRTDGRPGDACIVHWIPPIPVNGGGGDEVVHRAG